jgi:hypothetical protein
MFRPERFEMSVRQVCDSLGLFKSAHLHHCPQILKQRLRLGQPLQRLDGRIPHGQQMAGWTLHHDFPAGRAVFAWKHERNSSHAGSLNPG